MPQLSSVLVVVCGLRVSRAKPSLFRHPDAEQGSVLGATDSQTDSLFHIFPSVSHSWEGVSACTCGLDSPKSLSNLGFQKNLLAQLQTKNQA